MPHWMGQKCRGERDSRDCTQATTWSWKQPERVDLARRTLEGGLRCPGLRLITLPVRPFYQPEPTLSRSPQDAKREWDKIDGYNIPISRVSIGWDNPRFKSFINHVTNNTPENFARPGNMKEFVLARPTNILL